MLEGKIKLPFAFSILRPGTVTIEYLKIQE